jgi:hypothetical protein
MCLSLSQFVLPQLLPGCAPRAANTGLHRALTCLAAADVQAQVESALGTVPPPAYSSLPPHTGDAAAAAAVAVRRGSGDGASPLLHPTAPDSTCAQAAGLDSTHPASWQGNLQALVGCTCCCCRRAAAKDSQHDAWDLLPEPQTDLISSSSC